MLADPVLEHTDTIELTIRLRVAVLSPVAPGERQLKQDAAAFNMLVQPLVLSEARKQYSQKLSAIRGKR